LESHQVSLTFHSCCVHNIYRGRHKLVSVGLKTAACQTCASFLSLAPTPCLSPFLPWTPFPWQQKTTAVRASLRKTSAGNYVWFFFVNYVSAPRAMSCDGGRPMWCPQGKLFVFGVFRFRGFYLKGMDTTPVLGAVLPYFVWSSLALHCINLLYYILLILYVTVHYYTLL
jgi:hypothetical protein